MPAASAPARMRWSCAFASAALSWVRFWVASDCPFPGVDDVFLLREGDQLSLGLLQLGLGQFQLVFQVGLGIRGRAPKRRSMPAAMKPSATALAARAENCGEELSKLIRTSRELRTGSTLNPPLATPAARVLGRLGRSFFFLLASAFDCGRNRARHASQPAQVRTGLSSAAWSS